MNYTLLVVEENAELREYLVKLLIAERYTVLAATEGPEALKLFKKISPDLVILDVDLSTISGATICTEMKQLNPKVPVLVLTTKDSPLDIVTTLNLGADDYMTKPLVADELVARLKARLRGSGNSSQVLTTADLTFDPEKVEVTRNGSNIQLTPLEFRLLEYLLLNKGHVLSRDMILARVWASSPEIETRVVDVYIGYLRKKIDKNFTKPLIQSIRGFGYLILE